MRIFLLIAFMFLNIIVLPKCYALEDVILDASIEDSEVQLEDETDEQDKPKEDLTFYEKIQNIKSKEFKNDEIDHLLKGFLTKDFEKGIIDDIQFFGYYRDGFDMELPQNGDSDFLYRINVLQAGFKGHFKDRNTQYEASFKFDHQHNYTFFQFLPTNLYISNTSIPHHTIMFGNMRTPTGIDGGETTLLIPFIARSQIGRTFGNTRKVGIRVKGSYDLIDYDLGGYDSDTFFREFFPGAEFTGHVKFKPLGKTDGKYGDLKIGGGISTGHNKNNYFVSSAFAEYKYKKAFANFEWSAANGYNGQGGLSTNHAEGFYTTVGYNITPKLQVLARYDEFKPDKNLFNVKNREYTAGINWFIKGQALKLMLNYVFCQNDNAADSHRIILGTQLIL